MSRCFPFPPPGYEKKARINDVDVLTKEKNKEKKHKKEKKDRDKKREGKEKKDKERSKDKHKEKNDRKEKHKDKKKDKDRDKDKSKTSDDKSKNSVQKRTEGIPGGYDGAKPAKNFQQQLEIKDSKSLDNLGRFNGDEERRMGNQMVETINGTNIWRAEGMSRVVEKDFERRGERDEKGVDRKVDGQSKTDVEGCAGSMVVQNFNRVDQKRVGTDYNIDKKGHDRKAGGQRSYDGDGGMGSAIVQNFTTGVDEKRVEGMASLMDEDAEKVKEKNKSKVSYDKEDGKHKKCEKKSKGKDKDRDKKKEKVKERDKSKEKVNLKNNKQDNLTDSGKDRSDTPTVKPPQIPKDINNGAAVEGNFRKRKDPEANGFLHENEIRPNKLLRPEFPAHPFTENGRELEPCQIAIQCAPAIRQGEVNNLKVDNKEHKVNGIVEARTSSINSTKSSFANLHAGENGGASTKPPHPDTKYLSQILSIPKMEEWSDFDDQDWLFSENLQLKRLKDGSPGVEERPQVWAGAIRIESADVCALPYVIPY